MRIKQLDGVRALAILMVLAEHGFNLKMGWAGVDLFFVLSGFLITGILRRDRQSTGFWQRFYIKRAARILPPFALCLLATALIFHPQLHTLWLAFIFFGANIVSALHPDMGGPLSILWSLAVEEHFYLVWPFAIRFMNRKHLIQLSLALLIMEPFLRALATPHLPSYWTIYYLTPFRLDGLAAGSLLALLIENDLAKLRLRKLSAPVLAVSGVFLVGAMGFVHTFKRPANSIAFNSIGYSLVTVVAASFITYTLLHETSAVTRILSWRPAVLIGQISYGIYLFHLIFILIAQQQPLLAGHHAIEVLVALSATVLFSWLSFRFYETPCIRWGHRQALRVGR